MDDEAIYNDEILTTGEVEISRRDGAGVVLRIRGGEEIAGVNIYNPLPLEKGLRYICLTNRKGRELATVRLDKPLSPEAAAIVREELSRRYFSSIIERILSIEIQGHSTYWDVETDRGRCSFILTEPVENIRYPEPGHLIITDPQENRFEIRDLGALDPASRRLLDKVL